MSDDDDGLVGTPADTPPDRDHVLSLLDDALAEAHRKVESGRVYDAENERVRQGWFKTLAYLAGQYRQLLRDRDLEELSERVDRLEGSAGERAGAAGAGSSDLLESAPRVTVPTDGESGGLDTNGDTGADGPIDTDDNSSRQ